MFPHSPDRLPHLSDSTLSILPRHASTLSRQASTLVRLPHLSDSTLSRLPLSPDMLPHSSYMLPYSPDFHTSQTDFHTCQTPHYPDFPNRLPHLSDSTLSRHPDFPARLPHSPDRLPHSPDRLPHSPDRLPQLSDRLPVPHTRSQKSVDFKACIKSCYIHALYTLPIHFGYNQRALYITRSWTCWCDLVVLAAISFVYISDAGITKMDFVFDIIASSTLWLLLGNVLEKSRTIQCYRKQGNDAQWDIAGPRILWLQLTSSGLTSFPRHKTCPLIFFINMYCSYGCKN